MGWLLYSTKSMDLSVLAAELINQVGVQIALRYKYINIRKYKTNRDKRKKWMATHIEVDTNNRKQVARRLAVIYDSGSTMSPIGIRMRLVSDFRDVKGNSTLIGKDMHLRVRQASFISIQTTDPQTPGKLFHVIGKDW